MTITIVGTGYVGLVTGAVFADFGHKVYCLDIDQNKIAKLKGGDIPFYEPGLEELVRINLAQKRLVFTTSYSQSIPKSKVVFICVGTPAKENGEADLTYLFSSIKETAKHLKGYTLMAIKSTVPIGVEVELEAIMKNTAKNKFEFASCPEFLREGSAVEDAKNPDRIVIGTKSTKAADLLLDLYKHLNGQRLVCDLRSAQTIKYAANTYLATKISFANAIANICEKLGADAETVLTGVGLDRRIGKNFLSPGVGYGGSCFPKDVAAFIQIADSIGYNFSLLKATQEINKKQVDLFIDKITQALGTISGKTVGILGLAFKPNTDDIREAPSVRIISKLLQQEAKIKAYDPAAANNVRKVFGSQIELTENPYDALTDAEVMLVITEWNEFKELDLVKAKKLMSQPVIIDGRNIYDPEKVQSLGFIYQGIGRKVTSSNMPKSESVLLVDQQQDLPNQPTNSKTSNVRKVSDSSSI